MASSERHTRAARSGFVPKCAGRALWAIALLLAACLNPMPDDFPSSRDTDTPVITPGLGGASAVEGPPAYAGGGGGAAGGNLGEGGAPSSSEPNGLDGGEPDAGPPDSGLPDSGAPRVAPADAGVDGGPSQGSEP
jgi:hypothetical protein